MDTTEIKDRPVLIYRKTARKDRKMSKDRNAVKTEDGFSVKALLRGWWSGVRDAAVEMDRLASIFCSHIGKTFKQK